MTNSKYARWLKINSPAEYADKLRFANNADEILYRIIEECKLDFEKIIKYARETNNRKVLDKLFVIAR